MGDDERITSIPFVQLVITTDLLDIDFTHIQLPNGFEITLLDLPTRLRYRILPVFHALIERKIIRLDIDTRRKNFALVQNLPYDLNLLGIRKDPIELLLLVQWWTRKIYRDRICFRDIFKHQPHPTWTCECGEIVSANKNLCPNSICPSWKIYFLCTGKKQ